MKSLATSLCHCIKQVRKTVRPRDKSKKSKIKNPSFKEKEAAAIGICIKSVLHTRGKTLKRFKCGKKPFLITKMGLNK
jgi:hypothetical protein